MEPKGEYLIEGLCRHFGKDPELYEISWDHLPAMQKDAKTEAEVNRINVTTLKEMIALGIPEDEALQYLGMADLTIEQTDELEDDGNELV